MRFTCTQRVYDNTAVIQLFISYTVYFTHSVVAVQTVRIINVYTSMYTPILSGKMFIRHAGGVRCREGFTDN